MKTNLRHGRLAATGCLAICLLLAAAPTAKAGVILPTPSPGVSLQYGDFDIYSLALLHYLSGAGGNLTPGNAYYVASSPGNIGPPTDLVIGTGPDGNKDNESPLVDNAWGTPRGGGGNTEWFTFAPKSYNDGDITHFSTPSVDWDPASTSPFTGYGDGTWDATASVINDRVALLGDDTIFFFNLNETGTDNDLLGKDLLVYVKMQVRDELGNFVTFSNTLDYLEVSGTNSPVGPVNSLGEPGGPALAPDGRTNWAYVHSQITVGVNELTGERQFIGFGAPASNDTTGFINVQSVNQNLGANNAAFAAFNPELNQILKDNPTFILSFDMELANINNGYEQVFIRGGTIEGDVFVVPEPASLAAWSIFGMLGLTAYMRKKKV